MSNVALLQCPLCNPQVEGGFVHITNKDLLEFVIHVVENHTEVIAQTILAADAAAAVANEARAMAELAVPPAPPTAYEPPGNTPKEATE